MLIWYNYVDTQADKFYYCTMKTVRFVSLIYVLAIASCSSIQKSIVKLESKYQYNAGFYLIDPSNNKVLEDYRSNRYFTPASNTKIYTLYAASMVLPDSMPAFKYVKSDSGLVVWGTADPSFLNPLLPQSNVYSFLAGADKIYLSSSNFEDARFGAGWAWDDYNGGYSQEKTAFPIYGNSVQFNIDRMDRSLVIQPAIFTDSVRIKASNKFAVNRQEFSNKFEWDTAQCNNCARLRPIYFSNNTTVNLLKDTLHIPIEIVSTPLLSSSNTYYSIPTDSVLKVMMQASDNFLAEHLLLAVAAVLTDTLSTPIAIREMDKKMEAFLPDKLVWRDGSGLSRYNLFTPRNMVALWAALYKEMGEERLFSLISVGGKSGTLEHWFGAEKPYIYGKTGTLSNVFSLSGFLITKSGKRLIFSTMNNNFPVQSSVIKKELELILREIHEKY